MSLINETFSSLPNELSSIEYKHMSCVANAELWLLIYLIIKTVIEIVLYHFYIVFPYHSSPFSYLLINGVMRSPSFSIIVGYIHLENGKDIGILLY